MNGYLAKPFLFSLLGLAALIVLVSGAIFFRVIVVNDEQVTGYIQILGWQTLTWVPWVFFFALLSLEFGKKFQTWIQSWSLAPHIVASLAITSLHTLWFKFVSENLSPFLGLEDTRYGVFAWFFIFWFFLGLLLYWGSVNFFGLSSASPKQGGNNPSKPRLVVKTGKVSEVIDPKDVFWVEAQDYYSVLHLKDRQSWIKMTMKELENMLDPATFVRIHRSTIINIHHLKQIKTESPGKYSAVMNDGKKRSISRAGWRDLKKILKTTP